MRTYLPAGTGEKAQYLVHSYNDNTIRFVLYYSGTVDSTALCAAAKAVTAGVEILHASFLPGRLSARWQVHEDWTAEDCFLFRRDEDPRSTARELALQPISPQGKTQLRCCLVQGTEEAAVAVTISHLCVDGSDGIYLLTKLAEAYTLFCRTGSCQGFTVKNGGRSAEQVYAHLTGAQRRSLLTNPLANCKSAFSFPTEDPGMPRAVVETIPAAVMSAAKERARPLGATANDLILTACYHGFAAACGLGPSDPVSIISMMDLRRHLEGGVSKGLSNLAGSLPTTLSHGVGEDFSATLLDIAGQTRRAKEDPLSGLWGMPLLHGMTRSLPMGLLLRLAGKVYGGMSVGLTNLGTLPGEALRLDGLSPCGGWFAGPVKKKPGMQISAASINGDCALCVAGQYSPEDIQALGAMLSHISGYLTAFAQGGLEKERDPAAREEVLLQR